MRRNKQIQQKVEKLQILLDKKEEENKLFIGDNIDILQELYDKNGELKKENFDATDSYIACLGQMNKERYGELNFESSNIQIFENKVEYDVLYWDKIEHRTTYLT